VILFVHGFPGCADHGGLMAMSPLWGRFRLIAMDRPGYGGSDLQRNITPSKFARQIRDFLDTKGIDQVSILTVSGGAPYAMAVAYLLKERVRKVTSVAGVAPLTLKNFRYLNPAQLKMWLLRTFVPRALLEFVMNRIWNSGIEKIDQFLFSELEDFSPPDRKVFAHAEVGPVLVDSVKIALSQGPGGILEDMRVYKKSWGFPLDQVTCPVTLWHGTWDDVVHHKYAEELSALLPRAEVRFVSDEGHYSLPMNCRDQIIGDLLGTHPEQ